MNYLEGEGGHVYTVGILFILKFDVWKVQIGRLMQFEFKNFKLVYESNLNLKLEGASFQFEM